MASSFRSVSAVSENYVVNQSSDFPVRRTGSYRHKKALVAVEWAVTRRRTTHLLLTLDPIFQLMLHVDVVYCDCSSLELVYLYNTGRIMTGV